MVDDDRTVGLVLAAGAGIRYGRPKILVQGWLTAAVRALRLGGCDSVAVVTGAARPTLPDDVTEVHCATWDQGIGASLRAGLSTLPADAARVVVHLVDTPDIGPAVVRRVLDHAGDGLARAVYGGRPGHPVIIPRPHVTALLSTLRDEDGAGPYLRQHPTLDIECADLATGEDIDHAPDHHDPMGGSDL